VENPEEQLQLDPFSEFDPQVRESVDGLLYLGHLQDAFEFCGHTFEIRTLKTGEELLAGQVSKEYLEIMGSAKAWMAANVGLTLVAVDFDNDFCPSAGPNPLAFARARFNYVIQNWYTPTIEFIFGKYNQLNQKQVMAINAIADLSSGNLPSFTPLGGSLTGQGTSPEQTDGVTQTQHKLTI
jgi:hypothetical protein